MIFFMFVAKIRIFFLFLLLLLIFFKKNSYNIDMQLIAPFYPKEVIR